MPKYIGYALKRRVLGATLFVLLLGGAQFAEEVLSSEPVLITPKRIDTRKSQTAPQNLPPTRQSRALGKEEAPAEMPLTIDTERVVLKIPFKPGSIRLSREARRALKDLKLKPGQSLRISGLGDSTGSVKGRNSRLANLRARVIASYLEEFVGELQVGLQWNARPPEAFAGFGAIVEARD